MKRAVGATALVALFALAACGQAGNTQSASDEPTAQVTSQAQDHAAEAATEFLENFREGVDLPADWPADTVVVPEGATPVASLAKSTLPGYGEASAVFYSAGGQSGEEIADFFEEELPERGWTVINRIDQDGYSEVSVQGHGYLGIFGAGEIPSRPTLKSREVMDVQVVLAKLSG